MNIIKNLFKVWSDTKIYYRTNLKKLTKNENCLINKKIEVLENHWVKKIYLDISIIIYLENYTRRFKLAKEISLMIFYCKRYEFVKYFDLRNLTFPIKCLQEYFWAKIIRIDCLYTQKISESD